jgi:hypothetical protein
MHLSCKYLIDARPDKGYSYPEYRYIVLCVYTFPGIRVWQVRISHQTTLKKGYTHMRIVIYIPQKVTDVYVTFYMWVSFLRAHIRVISTTNNIKHYSK